MARGGMQRGTPQWEENLTNLRREQSAERAKLRTGSTATELKEHGSNLLNFYTSGGSRMRSGESLTERLKTLKTGGTTPLKDWSLDTARASFISDQIAAQRSEWEKGRSGTERRTQSVLGGMNKLPGATSEFNLDKAQKEAEKKWAEREKEIREQYKKGEWFGTEEYQVTIGRDKTPTTRTRDSLTDAGRMRIKELMSSSDNPFGRPLEDWEAIQVLKYGVDTKQKTPEQLATERAGTAAAGQRSGREAAAAQTEDAQQRSTASPWARSRRGILDSFGIGG